VRPYMERAAAYVVPLRIGGGTRLKIYEAMAMEKPIISTSVGAEGLPLNDGAEILLADTAESFAASVVKVLKDESLARQIGLQAATRVREEFGWQRVAQRFGQLCEETVVDARLRRSLNNENAMRLDGNAVSLAETQ
jgi:polysaccharide biosynthesis protein PslH